MKPHEVRGRGMNHSSGSEANAKRRAPSIIGLTADSARFITTKFSPQMTTTVSAASRSPRDRPRLIGGPGKRRTGWTNSSSRSK